MRSVPMPLIKRGAPVTVMAKSRSGLEKHKSQPIKVTCVNCAAVTFD